MRSEELITMKAKLASEATKNPQDPPTLWHPAQPWSAVFRRAASDDSYWNTHVINPANRWPVFICLPVAGRGTSLLPAVGMRPVIHHDGCCGMGGVDQRIVITWPDTVADVADLSRNSQHGVTKPVNLSQ